MNRRGMEMWQLVLMILALVLLFFIIIWYTGLSQGLEGLFKKLGDLF